VMMGIGVIVVGAGLIFLGPQLAARLAPPVPTPQCVQPTLTLGAAVFTIESLAHAADGSVVLPADEPGVAYWIEGTSVNYVFALSTAPDNLALRSALKAGDEATIVWADCGTDEYVVKSLETGVTDMATLTDQSAGGVTVFVQSGPGGEGFTIKGGRPEVKAVETPGPANENEIQADISFLGDTTSADGKTIRIGVSILNRGARPISLTSDDISLTPESAAPIPLLSVEPALPRDIEPGATETFYLTFARPGVNVAVLRILTFSSDYYF